MALENPEDKEHVLAEHKYHDTQKSGPFLWPDSAPYSLFCTGICFMGSWRNLALCRKLSGWERCQTPHRFTKPELVIRWKKKRFIIVFGNLQPVHISGCLQVLAEVILCTMLRWYLCHDLGIHFLASICFSSFLFFWHPMPSVNCLHSSHLLK